MQVRTEVTGEMLINRGKVNREINAFKVNIDKSVFTKTKEARKQVSLAKSSFKANKNGALHQQKREEMLGAITAYLAKRTPSWGIGSKIDFNL